MQETTCWLLIPERSLKYTSGIIISLFQHRRVCPIKSNRDVYVCRCLLFSGPVRSITCHILQGSGNYSPLPSERSLMKDQFGLESGSSALGSLLSPTSRDWYFERNAVLAFLWSCFRTSLSLWPSLEPLRVDTVCEAWHQLGRCHRGESAPQQMLITEPVVEVERCQAPEKGTRFSLSFGNISTCT